MSQTKALALALANGVAASALALAPDAIANDAPQGAPWTDERTAPPAEADPALEPKRRARDAFERATRARSAGDRTHAPLLTALGNAWLELAADVTRAAQAEQEATRLERELGTLETKLVRGRALLEETLARRGRAAAKLRELESARSNESSEPPETPKGNPKP